MLTLYNDYPDGWIPGRMLLAGLSSSFVFFIQKVKSNLLSSIQYGTKRKSMMTKLWPRNSRHKIYIMWGEGCTKKQTKIRKKKKKNRLCVCVCVECVFQRAKFKTKKKIIPIHSFQLYTARRDQCGGARSQTQWTQKGKLLFIHVNDTVDFCCGNIYNFKMIGVLHACAHTYIHTGHTQTYKLNQQKRKASLHNSPEEEQGGMKEQKFFLLIFLCEEKTRAYSQ